MPNEKITQTTEAELTKGQFIANRIKHLITMMKDVSDPCFDSYFSNYDPQQQIEEDMREIAEAIDGKI